MTRTQWWQPEGSVSDASQAQGGPEIESLLVGSRSFPRSRAFSDRADAAVALSVEALYGANGMGTIRSNSGKAEG